MEILLSYDFLYLIPLLVSACLSLRSFRENWHKSFKIFSLFLLSTLATEMFAIFWQDRFYHTAFWSYSRSNLWIYNAFVTVRFLFIVYFFSSILQRQLRVRAFKVVVIGFTVFSVINYFYIQSPHHINTFSIVLAHIITVALVIMLFYHTLQIREIIALQTVSEVWIALGTLIYYSGTLPFFLFLDYLIVTKSPLLLSVLHINDGLNVVMYSSYLIAFLCKPHFLK
jgi:hypothetical protein